MVPRPGKSKINGRQRQHESAKDTLMRALFTLPGHTQWRALLPGERENIPGEVK
jgi:hypothetical protein